MDSLRLTLIAVGIVALLLGGTSAGIKSERDLSCQKQTAVTMDVESREKRAQSSDLPTYQYHRCMRPCQDNAAPMTCEYEFNLELYFTLTKACYDCPINITDCYRPHCVAADGVPRGILTVNRMMPGPAIHVCEGDTIVVHVVNDLTSGEGTSIHWHGIFQEGSQFMDGVGMVTQCPIPIKTSFEYRFKAANAGTHFWHAHSGLQRADGLFGSLIVRQADSREAHLGLYEEDLPEHTVIVNDWLVEMSVNRFAHHHHAGGDNKPRSMLINGKGVMQSYFDSSDNSTDYTPMEVFHVTRGRRYRFRVISNGILNCPIQVSIDNHTLTMIASDGNAFEKVDVQSFNIFAGERYDFVLNASLPVGNYWLRVRGLADCDVKQAKQVAILRYMGAPKEMPNGTTSWEDADRQGKKLNPWNKRGTDQLIPVTDLTYRSAQPKTTLKALKPIPDKKFYLAMDFNKIDNFHFHDVSYYPIAAVARPMHLYLPQMNHISLTLPSSPPLTQPMDTPEEDYCNHETIGSKNCSAEYCECIFRLQVDVNDVVELVILDEGVTFNANHPMHLHGHAFHVVAMDRLGVSTSLEEVQQLDLAGNISRNLDTAILKDSVTVPDGGYTILRFLANNPGVWFFHCHIEFHVDIGMGLLLQVGNVTDMPKRPKDFPKCGHWKMNGYETDPPVCTVGAASQMSTVSTTSLLMACITVVCIWIKS